MIAMRLPAAILALFLLVQDEAALRKAVSALSSSDIEAREAAAKTLREALVAKPRVVLPILEEAARSADVETAGRAKELLAAHPFEAVAGATYAALAVTRAGKAVEGAVVTLESDAAENLRAVPKDPVMIEWKDGRLTPPLTLATAGGTVRYSNPGKGIHNAHGISGARDFNFAVIAGKSVDNEIAAGRWRVKCDICNDAIWIVATPYRAAAITKAGGVVIFRVPEGKFVARAWHPEHGEAAEPVAINADASVELKLPVKK